MKIIISYEFDDWLNELPSKAKDRVIARMDFIAIHHFGDHKHFDGLVEFRWRNGLRAYSCMFNTSVIIMLCGGNKNGQKSDIKKAQKIRKEYFEGTRTF